MMKSQSNEISEHDLREFNLIANGHACFQAMSTACRLDLFTYLHGHPGTTVKEFAGHVKAAEHGIDVLFSACVALKLVRTTDGVHYHNSPLAERHLVKGATDNMFPQIEAHRRLVYPALESLLESLREARNVGVDRIQGPGTTLYSRLTAQPELERVFQEWMENISNQTTAGEHSALLRSLHELEAARHILDLGGGKGHNALAYTSAFPNVRVTIFDFPSVCELAKKNVSSHQQHARISFKPGDLMKDDWGKEYDTVLLSRMTPIFSPETNKALLKRAYDTLPPKGTLVIFCPMSEDDGSGPPQQVALSLYFVGLASHEGCVYRWKDYVDWVTEVGYVHVRKHNLKDRTNSGFVIARKP